MKLFLKNSHILSLTAATAFHIAAGFWAISPSDPIIINKQAITVSFVAPSSLAQKNDNLNHKEFAENLEDKNGLKKLGKTQKSQEENKQLADNKNTSGIVDKKATATNSAQTDPIFDAAYLNNPSPVYPLRAKNKNIEGKVLIKVLVSDDGNAKIVTIANSSGHIILDDAAIDAVKNWKFIPARKNGQNIQANVIVPVEFKII